jgi:hypothetical protein
MRQTDGSARRQVVNPQEFSVHNPRRTIPKRNRSGRLGFRNPEAVQSDTDNKQAQYHFGGGAKLILIVFSAWFTS